MAMRSVDIPVLGVCAATGHTKEEALDALQDLAQTYFEVLLEYGDPLPEGIEPFEVPAVGQVDPGKEVVTISI